MKKNLLFIIFVLGLVSIFWLGGREPINFAWEWDISNLKSQTEPGSLTAISFEDAVRLKEKLSNGNAAEKDLRDLEEEIWELTGGSAIYYQFIGGFTFPEIEELSGQLTTLVVAVKSETPCIYFVEKPMTEVLLGLDYVVWNEMGSVATIELGQTSARVAAKGYFTVYDRKPPTADKLSNTVNLAYTFSLS